ncbi:YggT family protein [Candidatus Margulisiibacteriota bacterium]
MIQIIETIINLLFSIYYVLLLVRAFLPYIPHNKFHPILKPIYDVTEPVLGVIRKGLPPTKIGFDASPFIVLILLWLLQQILFSIVNAIFLPEVSSAGSNFIG